jgi:hypothetical protein
MMMTTMTLMMIFEMENTPCLIYDFRAQTYLCVRARECMMMTTTMMMMMMLTMITMMMNEEEGNQ